MQQTWTANLGFDGKAGASFYQVVVRTFSSRRDLVQCHERLRIDRLVCSEPLFPIPITKILRTPNRSSSGGPRTEEEIETIEGLMVAPRAGFEPAT